MLRLQNITKEYSVADTKVQALKGISLSFRANEFVSILGPSGCGKTTTLNIIGGLDHYTDGDLFINGISTKNFKDRDCIVCAVMDARCNQVYNALFKIEGGKIKRLCEDRALKCSELADEIKRKRTALPIIVAGDGVDVFYPFVEGKQNVQKAMPHNKYQTATGVAFAALDDFLKGNTCSSGELLPAYLRLPQAERELKAKRGNE